jgi:hypothetical protein
LLENPLPPTSSNPALKTNGESILEVDTASPSSPTFYSPCVLNGRRYLRLSRTECHIPICQSFFQIVFPDLHSLSSSLQRHSGAMKASAPSTLQCKSILKEILTRVSKISTTSYSNLAQHKNVMLEGVAIMDELRKRKQNLYDIEILCSHELRNEYKLNVRK